MKLSSIEHLTAPEITADDVSALAGYLDLTEDTGANDSNLLRAFFGRAMDAVERHTGQIYRSCQLRLTFAADGGQSLILPVFPVQSIDGITLDGVAVDNWSSSPSPLGEMVSFPGGVSGRLVITLTAGFSSPVVPPPAFLAAILAIAADMYEHREAQSEVNLHENRTLKFVLAGLTRYNCG